MSQQQTQWECFCLQQLEASQADHATAALGQLSEVREGWGGRMESMGRGSNDR